MGKGLVSIITPCFNGGGYISHLLNSVLCQTYSDIEMFIIDDGSTDNSADIIKSYIVKFEAKGYVLNYLYQMNQGQSFAINRGLRLIRGKYVVWPDCDDFFSCADSIESMVMSLHNTSDEVSVVRCFTNIVDEKEYLKIGEKRTLQTGFCKTDLFEDCLFIQNGFWFGAGNFMAKANMLKKVLFEQEIYVNHGAGQNWQLLLPLLYKRKCITIDKCLYTIVRRQESHSRDQIKSFEQLMRRIYIYEDTIIHTITRMNNIDISYKNRYEYLIKKKYALERMFLCSKYVESQYWSRIYAIDYVSDLKSPFLMLGYYLSNFPKLFRYLYKLQRLIH